jgi:hypothetical protein
MSAGANCGTHAGLGTYQSGIAGGGLHSLVHTLWEKLGSHCAQLTPGAASSTAAIGTATTAAPAAVPRTNLVTQASSDGPAPNVGLLSLCPQRGKSDLQANAPGRAARALTG